MQLAQSLQSFPHKFQSSRVENQESLGSEDRVHVPDARFTSVKKLPFPVQECPCIKDYQLFDTQCRSQLQRSLTHSLKWRFLACPNVLMMKAEWRIGVETRLWLAGEEQGPPVDSLVSVFKAFAISWHFSSLPQGVLVGPWNGTDTVLTPFWKIKV